MSWPDDDIKDLVVGERPTLLEAQKGNELIEALNTLRNMSIAAGSEDQVLISDGQVAIEYAAAPSDFSGTIELLDATDVTKKWTLVFEDGVLESITEGTSNYGEKTVEICEDGSTVSVTFVVRS